MPVSTYAYQHYLLNSISGQLQSSSLKQTAQAPGIQSVYRVICHRPDDNAPDSVATLVSSIAGEPTLSVRYTDDLPPMDTTLTRDALKALAAAFSTVKFDRLGDQPDIPTQGVTLWLVERAAGGFAKSVLLAPDVAEGAHLALAARLREHLPQSVEAPQRH